MSYPREIIEKISTEYGFGKSAREVGEAVNLPWRKVVYLMDKYGIRRRTRSDASYLQHNKDVFHAKDFLTIDEERLKAFALGLLWEGGYINHPHTLAVRSENHQTLNSIVKLLTIICGVPKERIHIFITAYLGCDIKGIEQFWSRELNLPLTQFYKTRVLGRRGKGVYRKRRALYGTATLYVSNIKLIKQIKSWLDEYALVAQSVEHMHGKHEVIGSIPIEGSIASA
jgi:hypothetical protein